MQSKITKLSQEKYDSETEEIARIAREYIRQGIPNKQAYELAEKHVKEGRW